MWVCVRTRMCGDGQKQQHHIIEEGLHGSMCQMSSGAHSASLSLAKGELLAPSPRDEPSPWLEPLCRRHLGPFRSCVPMAAPLCAPEGTCACSAPLHVWCVGGIGTRWEGLGGHSLR